MKVETMQKSLLTSNTARLYRSRRVVAGLFLSISALGFWVGQRLPTPETSGASEADAPPLHVHPEALDFGEAWAQRDFHGFSRLRTRPRPTFTS